jgi:hypothetical protein
MNADLRNRIEALSVPEPNTGCWLWTNVPGSNGYGTIEVDGRRMTAHRLSYMVYVGDIASGLVVRHKCDVRACVNPAHLELGTHHDNMLDRAKRGRRDPSSPEQRREWSSKGGHRGSWGLGLDLKGRLDRLSSPSESGCIEWQGTVVKTSGYGEIVVDGRKIPAHRAAWMAHRGEIPDGLVIMHACDNRRCINPEHLSLGTRRDNSIDMARKGRSAFQRRSPEQRSESAKRAMRTLGPEGLRAKAAKLWAGMTPEDRARHKQNVSVGARAGWAKMTPEARAEREMKIREGSRRDWANMSPEERAERIERIKNGWANMTPEARAERVQKIQEEHRRDFATPEARAEHGRKISEGHRRAKEAREALLAMSPEARAEQKIKDEQRKASRSEVSQAGWSELTLEAHAERVKKIQDGHKRFFASPEARAEHGRKVSEGHRRRREAEEALLAAQRPRLLFNLLEPRVEVSA